MAHKAQSMPASLPLVNLGYSPAAVIPYFRWGRGRVVPPILRPLIHAYLLGYASTIAPRLFTLLTQTLARKRPRKESFLDAFVRVLRVGLHIQRFPTFCAVLVGGSTLFQVPLEAALDRSFDHWSNASRKRLSRWSATFIAACLSLRLLQSKHSSAFSSQVAVKSEKHPGVRYETIRYAGRTLDLTLFAATRALDVMIGEWWFRRKHRRLSAQKWTTAETVMSHLTDPVLFTLSCSLIMWAWIYNPSRLPRAYNKWIMSAAAVDVRLVEALRRVRTGELSYGYKDTAQESLLGDMCADNRWPLHWGDPARSIPFPCELVHMGCSPSCEYHALSRFARSFRWAMATYLPLNLALIVRQPNVKGVVRAVSSAARSSAFLGAFIMLFYYGVCLARTRLGPHLIGKGIPARQKLDGGLCVAAGCLLCGWSILIEKESRRKDMTFFVAPRALATLFPRCYGLGKQWRETFLFALSTTIVFNCAVENRKRVRGVLGSILATVLRP